MAWPQLLKGVAVEAHLQQVLHVEAHRLHVQVEQVDRVVQQQDDQHEEHPGGETDLGDPSNSVADPREDGARGNGSDGPDDHKLRARRDGNGRLGISTDTKYDFCPLLEIFDLKYQNIVVYQILEEGEGHG